MILISFFQLHSESEGEANIMAILTRLVSCLILALCALTVEGFSIFQVVEFPVSLLPIFQNLTKICTIIYFFRMIFAKVPIIGMVPATPSKNFLLHQINTQLQLPNYGKNLEQCFEVIFSSKKYFDWLTWFLALCMK